MNLILPFTFIFVSDFKLLLLSIVWFIDGIISFNAEFCADFHMFQLYVEFSGLLFLCVSLFRRNLLLKVHILWTP